MTGKKVFAARGQKKGIEGNVKEVSFW